MGVLLMICHRNGNGGCRLCAAQKGASRGVGGGGRGGGVDSIVTVCHGRRGERPSSLYSVATPMTIGARGSGGRTAREGGGGGGASALPFHAKLRLVATAMTFTYWVSSRDKEGAASSVTMAAEEWKSPLWCPTNPPAHLFCHGSPGASVSCASVRAFLEGMDPRSAQEEASAELDFVFSETCWLANRSACLRNKKEHMVFWLAPKAAAQGARWLAGFFSFFSLFSASSGVCIDRCTS